MKSAEYNTVLYFKYNTLLNRKKSGLFQGEVIPYPLSFQFIPYPLYFFIYPLSLIYFFIPYPLFFCIFIPYPLLFSAFIPYPLRLPPPSLCMSIQLTYI